MNNETLAQLTATQKQKERNQITTNPEDTELQQLGEVNTDTIIVRHQKACLWGRGDESILLE